jgi:hypothetical protein
MALMYPHVDMGTIGDEYIDYTQLAYTSCEPLFLNPLFQADHTSLEEIHESGTNTYWQSAKGFTKQSKTQPYLPGQMLSESANNVFGGTHMGFSNEVACVELATPDMRDQDGESDCSTTDTANDTMPTRSIQTALLEGPTLSDSSTLTIPHAGMVSDTPWPDYSVSYWMPPTGMPAQTGWPSMGSSGHQLGRCKPCAFLYKEGCMGGASCQYCHLCPPGEKQRRKRVIRSMQRHMGAPTSKA